MWFGVSILATGLIVFLAFAALVGGEGDSWHRDQEIAHELIGSRFAELWTDSARRDELAAQLAHRLGASVELEDNRHRRLAGFGGSHGPCHGCDHVITVSHGEETLGFVAIHIERSHHLKLPFVLLLLLAGGVLWAASGAIARRIARPLTKVERVAREIGEGNLSSRVELGRHDADEVGVVAEAINEMAARIEKQIAAQRELLAAVSHEMRTPLGHLRVLTELAREECADVDVVDQMEREIIEADALIGELLASSQLELAAINSVPLDANEVARRAAKRAGLPAESVSLCEGEASFEGDPTLLARALANLLDNAERHGGGASGLDVSCAASAVTFAVHDGGGGFRGVEPSRAFESFKQGRGEDGANDARGDGHASLGLGLALVERIARAHGGRAGAENLPDGGGARVWIEVARQNPPDLPRNEV